ncbi:MAG: hypothetical protein IPG43_11950 [Proteobacteria bacterium]|nr:hypothetical protein [Pseudomonadota bacterium]
MKLDGPLVSTDWLAQHLADPRLRLFDATIFLRHKPEGGYLPDSGRAQWQVEHIPGAGFLDVYQELSDTTREVSFMMPAPRDFAARMAALSHPPCARQLERATAPRHVGRQGRDA